MSWKASNAVAECSEARGNARLLAFVLAEAVHLEDSSCYVGTETLAARTKCHRNTVTSAMRALAEAGELRVWLRRVKRPNGAVNLYQLVLPGLPCDAPPPQAGDDPPDLGPGYAQELGEVVRTDQAGGSHNLAGGSHNQLVREPSTEPKTSTSKNARAKADSFPEDLPAELHDAAIAAGKILKRTAQERGVRREVTRAAVGHAVLTFPDRDHVQVARDVENWLLHGKGATRSCADVVARFRNFLKTADPMSAPPLATANGGRAGNGNGRGGVAAQNAAALQVFESMRGA